MKNFISLVIYGIIVITVISLFIQLLPFLIIGTIVLLVIRSFKNKNKIDYEYTNYDQNDYQEPSYRTSGNIKTDVIDVEYKETVEK